MYVEKITKHSQYLYSVMQLGRANAATLGFLPDGAYGDYASKDKHTILAAIEEEQLIGYVLYRETRGYARIQHLCVDNKLRHKGVATILIDELRRRTKLLKGIELYCRKEYEASKIWPHLGFVARGEKPGRGKKYTELVLWRIEYEKQPLTSLLYSMRMQHKTPVAIGDDIFFALQYKNDPTNLDVIALQADWLHAEIELCITQEITNLISREQTRANLRAYQAFASQFVELESDINLFEYGYKKLRSIFPDLSSEQDLSAFRQIARAASSNTLIFVTCSTMLLRHSEAIYVALGIRVLQPLELISRIYELITEVEFQPKRLGGTMLTAHHIVPEQIGALASYFCLPQFQEDSSEFESKLKFFMSNPKLYECFIIEDVNNVFPLALFVFNRSSDRELIIPLLRVRNDPLAMTLGYYLSHYFLQTAIKEEKVYTHILEPLLESFMQLIFQEDGFVQVDENTWTKLNIRAAMRLSEIIQHLRTNLPQKLLGSQAYKAVLEALENTTPEFAFEAEKFLWPIKLVDADIPTYVISIAPEWAIELFDEKLANQRLFKTEPNLALRRENVYYGGKRYKYPSSFGRILWYVTQSEIHPYTSCIRACSRIDNVQVGTPEELFMRNDRLGVFTLDNILKLAGKDNDKDIWAVQFSNTELFEYPVSLSDFRGISLDEIGKHPSLQTPYFNVGDRIFNRVYKMGFGLD